MADMASNLLLIIHTQIGFDRIILFHLSLHIICNSVNHEKFDLFMTNYQGREKMTHQVKSFDSIQFMS